MMSLSPSLGSPNFLLRELKPEERGLYLIHLLLSCANHVAAGSLENANTTLEQISLLASPDGDTMQRIAAYFSEALADRILKTWPGIHRALNSTRMIMVSEEILVQKLFFELFPFLKVAFALTNQAIIEAMEGEKMIHIIDLNAAEPAQWISLLQVLSARPEGPPHLRITGVHQKKEILDQIAHRLTEEAEKLDIPFQFNPVVSKLENLDFDKLRVKTGEALAISSILQLHSLLALDDEAMQRKSPLLSKSSNGIHLQRVLPMSQSTLGDLLEKDMVNGYTYTPSPDSTSSSPASLSTSNLMNMESFLNALWVLSPKVMVVTEQDSNHNGSTLMERLLEALYSYAALFDCVESTVSRTSLERFRVEKMLFGEEIKNIIACEGSERKERHEKLDKWFQRFDLAGFGNVPLSYFGMLQANRLLQSYGCEGYRMRDENGCVLICWQDRSLFSISAWRSRK
ncbi:scarecrow-like protein 3 isoform X2 [Gastrolobium bilobum]|nr:scarecrow-like protein 3 isoform X2 [Gastrolobium bilobum]XP_061362430.1 scarecrow-like protein 3 isoform X2 [Gastrolobium bilobum]XP_061362431.1 scarecrow-like protein 3 isoform X2 [Gastrolobium bilobum]